MIHAQNECLFKQQIVEKCAYEPLCARPVTRVDLAAPLELLFPLVGMGDLLPVAGVPFFLSLFLFVLNSDININFKLVKLQNQKIPKLKSQDPKEITNLKFQDPNKIQISYQNIPKEITKLNIQTKFNAKSQISNIYNGQVFGF
jgi:hypothetical protein